MKKAVLFDLDGTLVDSSEGITKCVQHALKYFGLEENNLDKLRVFIGPPLTDSFMKYYDLSAEEAREAVRVYRERYRPVGIFECCLYPGVEDCIRSLKNSGYTIGLASSKPEHFCRKILDHFDILDLFDDVVGATEDGKIGTKEEVLSEVMRRWTDIPKDNMCLIGDTAFDMEGANLVGISSIGVSFGFGDVQKMRSEGAKTICSSLMEIPAAVAAVL